jgi:RNase P/RNase MRP subunit p29
MLTQQRLKELFDYDGGMLIRLVRTSNRVKVGDAAGRVNSEGYRAIKIDGGMYLAHRLVWFYFTGAWPKGQIDHIDGDRLNNRIENLRDVTNGVNSQNLKRAQSNNKTGCLGVSPNGSGFMASIFFNGKKIYLGTYEAPQLAHSAYLAAKRKHHEGCTI